MVRKGFDFAVRGCPARRSVKTAENPYRARVSGGKALQALKALSLTKGQRHVDAAMVGVHRPEGINLHVKDGYMAEFARINENKVFNLEA